MRRYYSLWVYASALTAVLTASLLSMIEERRLLADVTTRASSVAISAEESVGSNYYANRLNRIATLAERIRAKHKMLGLTICDPGSQRQIGFPRGAGWEALCQSDLARTAFTRGEDTHWESSGLQHKFQYYSHRIEPQDADHGPLYLILTQDLTPLRAMWAESFFRTFAVTWIVCMGLAFLIARQVQSWIRGQLRVLHKSLRSLIAGKHPIPLADSDQAHDQVPGLAPISRDIDQLAAKILAMAPMPQKQALKTEATWLRSLRESMDGKTLTVIANREPYIHQRLKERIEVVRPASGLVTALEPILRQCGGLWIAHGSGTADRDTVDEKNEVAVPPGSPRYKLRRVWLTKEEEQGYYYGFSNEGFWPLCHLAHTRPTFRLGDWEKYSLVNQRFADAVPESAMSENNVILVQDYHFALLPRMLRNRARDGQRPKIGIFWHIPWPNPEAFGICPWNKDLLRGMLGADLIGFHTQYHCNNFLETCNRYLEARIDWERFSVTMENHETRVQAFPIGIDTSPVRTLTNEERIELKARYGIKAEFVAVGVDRLDYTKGLIERVEAVERFLEKHPEYVGRFTLVQMGSPSRSSIPAYRLLTETLTSAVERVNNRFKDDNGYVPVLFLNQHHEWDAIQYFYQLGDICMVTSLHDGMNLVAKEYVWCQQAERGSLILSKFTGASRELTEAFIVNPYAIEEMADAIAAALLLSPAEKAERMLAMKQKVQNRNAYHWASDLIQALVKTGTGVGTPIPEPDLAGNLRSIRGSRR